jgi:hypothetical protein
MKSVNTLKKLVILAIGLIALALVVLGQGPNLLVTFQKSLTCFGPVRLPFDHGQKRGHIISPPAVATGTPFASKKSTNCHSALISAAVRWWAR